MLHIGGPNSQLPDMEWKNELVWYMRSFFCVLSKNT